MLNVSKQGREKNGAKFTLIEKRRNQYIDIYIWNDILDSSHSLNRMNNILKDKLTFQVNAGSNIVDKISFQEARPDVACEVFCGSLSSFLVVQTYLNVLFILSIYFV